jgi:hypothetical protein
LSKLSKATLDTSRTLPERIYGALSLMSFKGRQSSGDKVIKHTRSGLSLERSQAKTNEERENADMIYSVMKLKSIATI